jgi:hypothetical protein
MCKSANKRNTGGVIAEEQKKQFTHPSEVRFWAPPIMSTSTRSGRMYFLATEATNAGIVALKSSI